MNILEKHEICLEICPKSNLDTKSVLSLKDTPIREFIKRGIMVSINTDDDTCSNTTIEKEYKSLADIGFNEKELQEFARNSIEASFTSQKIKN